MASSEVRVHLKIVPVLDEGIRELLIAMGWTPPAETPDLCDICEDTPPHPKTDHLHHWEPTMPETPEP